MNRDGRGERTPLDRFMEAYALELAAAVEGHPEEYAYPAAAVPEAVDRMRAAVLRGAYDHGGRAFRRTCAALDIEHSRRAIEGFLAGRS